MANRKCEIRMERILVGVEKVSKPEGKADGQ